MQASHFIHYSQKMTSTTNFCWNESCWLLQVDVFVKITIICNIKTAVVMKCKHHRLKYVFYTFQSSQKFVFWVSLLHEVIQICVTILSPFSETSNYHHIHSKALESFFRTMLNVQDPSIRVLISENVLVALFSLYLHINCRFIALLRNNNMESCQVNTPRARTLQNTTLTTEWMDEQKTEKI